MKLSVVEKVVNGEPNKGIEVFFENDDGVKARTVNLRYKPSKHINFDLTMKQR